MRCLMFAVTVAATSGLAVASGLTNTWTGAAHDGDWSNPQNFRDTSFAPGADDVVAIDEGCPAEIDASSASWERLNALRQVYPNGKDAQLIVTVPEGDPAVIDCPVTERDVSIVGSIRGANGWLVKKGAGTLELGATGKCLDSTSSHAFTSLRVLEGVLMMPQHCGNLNFSYLNLDIAEGATLYTVAQNGAAAVVGSWAYTTVYGTITGKGILTNQGQNMPFRPIKTGAKLVFEGRISGGVYLMVGSGVVLDLPNETSDYTSTSGIQIEQNATLGLAKIGRYPSSGEPTESSSGKNPKFEVYSNGRILYTGSGENNAFKSCIVRSSPAFLDAGANGGLDVDGSDWSGYYGSKTVASLMQQLVLDGSNTAVSVFHPYIRYWHDEIPLEDPADRTNCTFYISKRGTGTWWLKENRYSEWRGGTGVDNGTVQFDTLEELGKRCSFGMGTELYDDYSGPKDPAHKVDYAIRLGDGKTTGTIEHIGDNFISVTTRTVVVRGSGRILNSSTRRTRIANVSGIGTGENELILDGERTLQDTVENVRNGTGKLSVVKRGNGNWILGGEQTFEGDLKVEGGTLTVTDSKRYNWFKWTSRKIAAIDAGDAHNYALQAAQFALYDKDGNMVSKNMAVHGRTDTEIHGNPDYLTLVPHSAQVGRWEYKYDNPSLSTHLAAYYGEDYDTYAGKKYNVNMDFTWLNGQHMHLQCLFDDTPARYAWGDGTEIFGIYSRGTLDGVKEQVWVSVFMRTKPGTTVTAYDLATHKDYWYYLPVSWTLQGSVNGFDWVVLDKKDDVAYSKTVNNVWSSDQTSFTSGQVRKDKGYKISSGPANPPDVLTKVRSVYVAPGATLEADGDLPAISSLKTDTAGLGSIVGFTFAEEGSLDISGNLKGKRAEIPFGFANVESSANIAGWTLKANGQLDTHHTLTIRDGKFVIEPTGLTVIIR